MATDSLSSETELGALGVRRINADTDIDELVLPPESAQRLRQVGEWLVQPPAVYRDWGLHRYIDGGLRALFRGPPGTGKSMAAAALGRWTERPVFHVDLSAADSKYIGDTAKNLARVFDAANDESAILYFDEADALFGRRSEVKDAHDRYANVEIGYLLRRLEPFEGLAIVATNRLGKIDEDAVSRLDVIVDFPLPDEAAREEIWHRVLRSVKVPQEVGDSDIRDLASEYELSGAEILRCVRTAAFLAARAGTALGTELLKHSAADRVAMRGAP